MLPTSLVDCAHSDDGGHPKLAASCIRWPGGPLSPIALTQPTLQLVTKAAEKCGPISPIHPEPNLNNPTIDPQDPPVDPGPGLGLGPNPTRTAPTNRQPESRPGPTSGFTLFGFHDSGATLACRAFVLCRRRQAAVFQPLLAKLLAKRLFDSCILGLPVCSSENPCPLHIQAFAYREGLHYQLKHQAIGDLAKRIEREEQKI